MQIRQWKAEIQAKAKTLFGGKRGPKVAAAPKHCAPELLYSEIGRLKVELDWLKKVRAEPAMTHQSWIEASGPPPAKRTRHTKSTHICCVVFRCWPNQVWSTDITFICLTHGFADLVVISMDRQGRAYDNIFVERLWRSVNHADVYLNGYATMGELMLRLANYFAFHNLERPHQSLDNQMPDEVYQTVKRQLVVAQ
jgi:transposase InsO family protein